jgi:hypothetical protein
LLENYHSNNILENERKEVTNSYFKIESPKQELVKLKNQFVSNLIDVYFSEIRFLNIPMSNE